MLNWTDDPVRDAERYSEYMEEHGQETPESDHYRILCEMLKIQNRYLRRMHDTRTDQDSKRTEGAKEQA